MSRFLKLGLIFWCAVSLAGCAPHYYNFKLISKTTNEEEGKLKLIDYNMVARHLPGDQVDIFQTVKLVNTSSQELQLNDYSFTAESTVFQYELSSIIRNNPSPQDPGKGIVIYDKTSTGKPSIIRISPGDTLDTTLIYKLTRSISEEEFKTGRKGEHLTITMQFEKLKYLHKFIAKED